MSSSITCVTSRVTSTSCAANRSSQSLCWDVGRALTDLRESPTIRLLDGAEETITTLAAKRPLMLVTKGDLFDQESKIARSGLGDLFQTVEVVTTKDRSTYEAIIEKLGVAPSRFLMVGDSLKSDILPVLDMGGNAIHVPYDTTWKHEEVPSDVVSRYDFRSAASIRDVPRLIGELSA